MWLTLNPKPCLLFLLSKSLVKCRPVNSAAGCDIFIFIYMYVYIYVYRKMYTYISICVCKYTHRVS